jgi:hypothetical protein
MVGRILGVSLLPIAALACTATGTPRPPAAPPSPPAVLDLAGQPDPRPDAAFVEVARRECSICHLVPRPADLPRDQWGPRLQEMARFSLSRVGLAPGARSSLEDMDLSPFVRYFETRAPETLPAPEPWPPVSAGPVRFRRHLLSPPGAVPVPIVANVRFVDLHGDGRLEIVACDMGHGLVFLGDPRRRPGELQEIARIPNPVHATPADLDGDGLLDLLVADIGFFRPEDHEKGAVVWLRQTPAGEFEKHVLVEKLPRVTDVEAADLDGDGDLDLVVAAFGLHSRGATFLYTNETLDGKEPRFVPTTLDPRPGAIDAPVADLDGDGRPDITLLLAQQYETVLDFARGGPGAPFAPRTVFAAPTPAWGSTGIALADLDGDGDLDVLMTNGDTLDDATVKPYHGVRWLENRGSFPFVRHDLAALPGAHRAEAADLDGDGDLDVAVAAFLPDVEHTRGAFASLGWLEQTRPGEFVRHTLQTGQLSHTTLDVGDYDGDGDVDIVVGNFVGFTFARTGTGFGADGWVELWENLTREPPGTTPTESTTSVTR